MRSDSIVGSFSCVAYFNIIIITLISLDYRLRGHLCRKSFFSVYSSIVSLNSLEAGNLLYMARARGLAATKEGR